MVKQSHLRFEFIIVPSPEGFYKIYDFCALSIRVFKSSD
jgi:hypothetical protein